MIAMNTQMTNLKYRLFTRKIRFSYSTTVWTEMSTFYDKGQMISMAEKTKETTETCGAGILASFRGVPLHLLPYGCRSQAVHVLAVAAWESMDGLVLA